MILARKLGIIFGVITVVLLVLAFVNPITIPFAAISGGVALAGILDRGNSSAGSDSWDLDI